MTAVLIPLSEEQFANRVRFACLLATRLHEFGTAAQRLEAAVVSVSGRMGLICDIWSNPTGILLSFRDATRGDDPLAESTRVIRLAPGETNLKRLSEVDEIAELVYEGKMDLATGYMRLRDMRTTQGRAARWLYALCHGLVAGTVAAILKTGWVDVGVATLIGSIIGVLGMAARGRPQLQAGYEAFAALIAAFMVASISHAWAPLAVNSVLVASLIVLLPGLTLTTAVNELANQHLVSGIARLAGAAAVLLKLAFGTAAGLQLAKSLDLVAVAHAPVPVQPWAEWLALLVASWGFAVLFKAAARDYLLVMASAWMGYLITRFAGANLGAEYGVFVAGFIGGSVANLYARMRNRPGALVRVPGIILLVPGSVGFRSLFSVFEGNIDRGFDLAVSLMVLLISLVAGLLFANVAITPRRSLS